MAFKKAYAVINIFYGGFTILLWFEIRIFEKSA